MGKRVAVASTVTTGNKKKVKVDPIIEKCNVVTAALEKLADFPSATCDMLKLILPLSLGVCQNDRHQYQQSTVGVIAKELDKIEANQQSQISQQEAAKSSVEEEKKLQDAAVNEIKATLSTKQATLQEKKHQLCKEATAFQNAKFALKKAEDQQDNREKEFIKIERKKVDLESIIQNTFKSLKEGGSEQAEAQQQASEFVARLQGLIDLNETLATTIPLALSKEAHSRGPFDTIAIQQLEEDLEKCLTECKALIHNAEKVKAEHSAEVNTAREAFNAAQERQLTSAESFTTIRNEIEGIENLLREAKQKLGRFPLLLARAEKNLQYARNKLDDFRNGPLSVFAELRERNLLEVESKAEVHMELTPA